MHCQSFTMVVIPAQITPSNHALVLIGQNIGTWKHIIYITSYVLKYCYFASQELFLYFYLNGLMSEDNS